MPERDRRFVAAVRAYCGRHGIAFEALSAGWLLVMRAGEKRHIAYGYDIGLNSAAAHRVANDKAATAEILTRHGVPCVAHTLFLGPRLSDYGPASGVWDHMLRLLHDHPDGLVVKPNEGTSGHLVFKVRSRLALEQAVYRIFAFDLNLAISPYLDIDDEVRVVLLDGRPLVVYSKRRPEVVGDGRRTLLELALAAFPQDRLAAILPAISGDLDRAARDEIVPAGQRRALNWRHNLDAGAEPVLLGEDGVSEDCVRIAAAAAQAIGIRFCSVDLVRTGETWRVLEINSGVMMEALGERHPDIVDSVYAAALDALFGVPD